MPRVTLPDGALQARTSTGLRLTVRRLTVRRFETRVILCVRFTNGRSVTLNIARDRVTELVDLLGQWT